MRTICLSSILVAWMAALHVGAQQEKSEAPSPIDGVARVEGRLVYLKSGLVREIKEELKLSEGITARPNGAVVLPDGREIKLEENQMITLRAQQVSVPEELRREIVRMADRKVLDEGARIGDYQRPIPNTHGGDQRRDVDVGIK